MSNRHLRSVIESKNHDSLENVDGPMIGAVRPVVFITHGSESMPRMCLANAVLTEPPSISNSWNTYVLDSPLLRSMRHAVAGVVLSFHNATDAVGFRCSRCDQDDQHAADDDRLPWDLWFGEKAHFEYQPLRVVPFVRMFPPRWHAEGVDEATAHAILKDTMLREDA